MTADMFGAMTVHYAGTPFEIDAEHSKPLREQSLQVAQRVAAIARADAPHVSGEYEGQFRAEMTKAGARVVNDSPHATYLEFGAPGRGIPARWILRNAAIRAGLKFTKRRR